MRRNEILNRAAGSIAPAVAALSLICSADAKAQPDFTPMASYNTYIPTPFYTEEYYAADLATGDFIGASANAIDGYQDVAVFSGPLGVGPFDPYPASTFTSRITLFRNTQNWGTGGAPTAAL